MSDNDADREIKKLHLSVVKLSNKMLKSLLSDVNLFFYFHLVNLL